jgi:hypothetical protein
MILRRGRSNVHGLQYLRGDAEAGSAGLDAAVNIDILDIELAEAGCIHDYDRGGVVRHQRHLSPGAAPELQGSFEKSATLGAVLGLT